MGKSNLCLFSLHDERIISRFGDRRYFIRCDGDESREAVVAELAAALGITMSANAENEVLHELSASETVLVLDNFETPWGRDILHCEALLQNLATVPGLSLAVTIRGNMFPPLGWEQPMHIEPVSDATGR
ncbi:MAG TPA: hypothetical protein PKB07_11120 [Flavilitoribacter sp.]|nr:hypothetical protein [Flavilitoribacter sp.]